MPRNLIRASDAFTAFLDEYCKKQKLSREKALDQILGRLKYLEDVLGKAQPPEPPVHDLKHLNIDQKDGAIQTYLNKREARLELRRERIEDSTLREHGRQKAKTEGEAARAKIKEETANKAQFRKRFIRSGKPKVDWGNSAGGYVDGFELGDR